MTLTDLHVALTSVGGRGSIRIFSWDLDDWASGEGVVEARLVLDAGLDMRLCPLVSPKKQVTQRFALLVGGDGEPQLLVFDRGAWLPFVGKRAAWARRQLES